MPRPYAVDIALSPRAGGHLTPRTLFNVTIYATVSITVFTQTVAECEKPRCLEPDAVSESCRFKVYQPREAASLSIGPL